MYSCSVRSEKYVCKTKHSFTYDSHFKPLHQPKFFEALIDIKADATICVLGYSCRETGINLKFSLKTLFGGLCTVEYIYKITQRLLKIFYHLYISIDIEIIWLQLNLLSL